MKTIFKVLLIGLAVMLFVGLVAPFLIPVPPLGDTVPPEDLADADSLFVELNDLQVHYRTAGSGEPVFILLHGFGASLFSWREVMGQLGEMGQVIAYDRPAFGLTERPVTWRGENPYSPQAQVDLLVALMDEMGVEQAILVGNSAGGTVAVHTALLHPDRVQGLALVDPAIYEGGGLPMGWLLRPILRTPQARRLGPLFVRNIQEWGQEFLRTAWHDPSMITDEIMEGYTKPLQALNWDRALYEHTIATYDLNLDQRLDELSVPVLIITGDDDRIVPTENSIRLAAEIPDARLMVIEECGHVPQEECPEPWLIAVWNFAETVIVR